MTIRLTWRRVVGAMVALAAAGMLFAWSGLFNVAASSGHWAITDWFLHWTMRNSVRTYSAFTVPDNPKDDAGLVSAAGLYAQSCAACHGAPGQRPLPVMQAATPPAPDLARTAGEWNDAELFWIIRHGIKFTGMPAWAAEGREDEVRRMVAFVRALPGMSPDRYRMLTEDPTAPADAALARCTGCHGVDGRGRGQRDVPVLGGQSPAYLFAQLRAYARGRRQSAVMENAVAPLTDAEMRRLAIHFAGLPGLGGGGVRQTAALHGLPQRQLPACESCHDPAGRKPYPVLRGQRPAYIAARLRHWRGEKGVVDARQDQSVMPVIARRIPEDRIDAMARAVSGETSPRDRDRAGPRRP
jgi:cytochrome c553